MPIELPIGLQDELHYRKPKLPQKRGKNQRRQKGRARIVKGFFGYDTYVCFSIPQKELLLSF
jgi:hypothetical protein